MSITGGVKFCDKSLCLFKDGNDANASTNDDAANYLLSSNKYVRWESLNSNDITTETITINFDGATTIDRLFLVGHNLKTYTVKYNGTNEFANVVGLDGSLVGGIVESDYDKDTSYYEFDSVSVTTITITTDSTQIANEEKHITQVIATVELGTLAGFPRVGGVKHDRNLKGLKAISGKNVVQKGHETTSFKMNFKTYPVQADVDLIEDLHLKEDAFLVWLCGGRYGSDHFNIEQRGWRLEDIYNMQINRQLGADYEKGIYQNGVNKNVSFVEVI